MAGLPGLPALDRKPCCQNPVLRPVARLGLRNGGEGTVNGTGLLGPHLGQEHSQAVLGVGEGIWFCYLAVASAPTKPPF